MSCVTKGWMDISRFVEIAGGGDESVRPFANLSVLVWKYHKELTTQDKIPLITAVVKGSVCELTFHMVCFLDTEMLQDMIDKIPKFGERCVEVVADAEKLQVVYTLTTEEDSRGISNTRVPAVNTSDNYQLHVDTLPPGVSAERLTRITSIVVHSRSRIDTIDLEVESDPADPDYSEIYIGEMAQCSASILMSIVRDSVAQVQRATYTRLAEPTGNIRCKMQCVQSEDESTWNPLKLLRRKSRESRRPRPY